MKSRAKSKLRAFLSGFLSVFNLSGGRRYLANKQKMRTGSESMHRHWRRVGKDIECAAENLASNHGDDELREEVEEYLRRWRASQATYRHRRVIESKETDEEKKLISS
jgi:hypothetical protein